MPTNYIAALADPANPYHREAKRLVLELTTNATYVGGVMRWTSNNQVPFADVLELAAHLGHPVDVAKSCLTRTADTEVFLAEYRRMNDRPATAEERADMRAAFGPGHEVVNIITGRRTRT